MDAPISPEEFARRMADIYPQPEPIFQKKGYDIEGAHFKADELLAEMLTSLGYGEGADMFLAATKWYG
jgi:hypothetical protein